MGTLITSKLRSTLRGVVLPGKAGKASIARCAAKYQMCNQISDLQLIGEYYTFRRKSRFQTGNKRSYSKRREDDCTTRRSIAIFISRELFLNIQKFVYSLVITEQTYRNRGTWNRAYMNERMTVVRFMLAIFTRITRIDDISIDICPISFSGRVGALES